MKKDFLISLVIFSTITALVIFGVAYSRKQITTDVKRVGIALWAENIEYKESVEAFKKALEDLGYKEGINISYEILNANGNTEIQKNNVQTFVDNGVDLIYTITTPATLIAKKVTQSIPIVFSTVTFPVEAGIVESLQRSGNNLAGVRNWVDAQLQISTFLKIVPSSKSIAFVHRTGEINSDVQLEEFRKNTKAREVSIVDVSGSNVEEIKTSLDNLIGKVDSVYLACDTLIQVDAQEAIIDFARANKIPSFGCSKLGVSNGVLFGVVADFSSMGRLAGEIAFDIFSGIQPSEMEINTVSRPFIYFNLKTAEDLGIKIPQDLLSKASETF